MLFDQLAKINLVFRMKIIRASWNWAGSGIFRIKDLSNDQPNVR